MDLLNKANENAPRTPKEIEKMIKEAAKHYGNFLKSVGFDYEKDRQTVDTPKRVAKAWLKDLNFRISYRCSFNDCVSK
jgi:GTP cyclohydrolase I